MRIVVLIYLMFCFNSFGQEKKIQWNDEEVGDMSILLYRKINDSTANTGTGTIINNKSKYFILTAQHVALNMDEETIVVFRLPGDKPKFVNLKKLVRNNSINWINHKEADISIIELDLPMEIQLRERIVLNSFPIEQINLSKKLPSRDVDITFFGYPVIDLNMEHFSALNINSRICSGLITQKRADNKKLSTFFYLDRPSIQGCSGSGVYYSVSRSMYIGGNKTILIGIMHGTKSDNTGGKLSMITPSYYLLDLLQNY